MGMTSKLGSKDEKQSSKTVNSLCQVKSKMGRRCSSYQNPYFITLIGLFLSIASTLHVPVVFAFNSNTIRVPAGPRGQRLSQYHSSSFTQNGYTSNKCFSYLEKPSSSDKRISGGKHSMQMGLFTRRKSRLGLGLSNPTSPRQNGRSYFVLVSIIRKILKDFG